MEKSRMDNAKNYCSVCHGKDIVEHSYWPTKAYEMGRFFCSDSCKEQIIQNNPKMTLFLVLLVTNSGNFSLHHDNSVCKTVSTNNYGVDKKNSILVFARTEEEAVQATKWVYPAYSLYIVVEA